MKSKLFTFLLVLFIMGCNQSQSIPPTNSTSATSTPESKPTSTRQVPTATPFSPPIIRNIDREPLTSFSNPNFIYDIVVDQDGIVWAAGSGGIVRYEPESEEHIHFTVDDGLPGNSISRIELAPSGEVYIYGFGGIVVHDGKHWSPIPAEEVKDFLGLDTKDIEIPDYVRGTIIHHKGTVWAAGHQLWHFDGTEWIELYYSEEFSDHISVSLHIYDMFVDAGGALWISTGTTGRFPVLYRYDGQNWLSIDTTAQEYLPEIDQDTTMQGSALGNIWPDPDAGIWWVVNTLEGSYLIHYTDSLTSIKLPEEFDARAVSGFAVTNSGGIWLSSIGSTKYGPAPVGLFHYDSNGWKAVEFSSTLSANSFSSCKTAPDGDLWTNQGLLHFDDLNETLIQIEGNPLELYNFTKDSLGQLWASSSDKLYFLEDGNWELYVEPPAFIASVVVSNKDNIWFKLWGVTEEIWHYDGCEFTNHLIPNFEIGHLDNLLLSPQGRLFIDADSGGIFEFYEGEWQQISPYEEFSVQTMHYLNDELWVINWGDANNKASLWSYDGQAWLQYPQVLPEDRDLWIRTISSSQDGTLWISTSRHGAIGYKPATNEKVPITITEGLASNNVWDICAANDGRIWFGTDAGISILQP